MWGTATESKDLKVERQTDSKIQRKRESKRVKVRQVIETIINNFLKNSRKFNLF